MKTAGFADLVSENSARSLLARFSLSASQRSVIDAIMMDLKGAIIIIEVYTTKVSLRDRFSIGAEPN